MPAVPIRSDWYYVGAWTIPPGKGPVKFFKNNIQGQSLSWFAIAYKETMAGDWRTVFRVMTHDAPDQLTPEGDRRHCYEKCATMPGDATDVEVAQHVAWLTGLIAYQLHQPTEFSLFATGGRRAASHLRRLANADVCQCSECLDFQVQPLEPSDN